MIRRERLKKRMSKIRDRGQDSLYKHKGPKPRVTFADIAAKHTDEELEAIVRMVKTDGKEFGGVPIWAKPLADGSIMRRPREFAQWLIENGIVTD